MQTVTIEDLADQLGEIRERISGLQEQENLIRAEFLECCKAEKCRTAEGEHYDAEIIREKVRSTDWRDVVASLPQTPGLLRRIANRSAVTTRVRVYIVAK